MPRPVIVVMMKAPHAGEVKTRLVPPLTTAEAASLAACFARDTVNNLRGAAHNIIIAYAPAGSRRPLEAMLPRELSWLEQRGDDLGARLDHAVSHAAARGFGPVVVTGADSPTLPPQFIEAAISALTEGGAEVALGPTSDGGYYAVGVSHPVPQLFDRVAWSTSLAYEQTAANAARLGLRLAELSAWYDVDTPADLARLRGELLADEDARRRAPETHRWLLDYDAL